MKYGTYIHDTKLQSEIKNQSLIIKGYWYNIYRGQVNNKTKLLDLSEWNVASTFIILNYRLWLKISELKYKGLYAIYDGWWI